MNIPRVTFQRRILWACLAACAFPFLPLVAQIYNPLVQQNPDQRYFVKLGNLTVTQTVEGQTPPNPLTMEFVGKSVAERTDKGQVLQRVPVSESDPTTYKEVTIHVQLDATLLSENATFSNLHAVLVSTKDGVVKYGDGEYKVLSNSGDQTIVQQMPFGATPELDFNVTPEFGKSYHLLIFEDARDTAGDQDINAPPNGIFEKDEVTHHGLLVPIEVKKVWSDQFSGVEANFLPGGTGLGNKRYIFMGAAQSNNFDGKAHVKAKVSVGGSPEFRNKILWRIAKDNGSGGYTPMSGDSSYDANGEMVTITRDYPSDDPDQNYVLVAGYDADGDGYLFSSEINFIPKYTDGGQEHTYQFKVISSARYNDARAAILNWASNSSVAFPQGSICLNAFATETAPTGATSEPTTIDRLEPGLDHPVGVLFKSSQNSNGGVSNSGPGDSITAVFSPMSRMCSDVAESTTFNNWLASKLDPHAPDVVAYFADPANAEENTVTLVFQFSTVNASTGKEEGIEFTPDPDLFLAIGKGAASVEATVVVHRSLYVESLTINGSLHDLYDFNYDGAESVFVKPASSVQAGYNTLGVGGRVYKSRVDFDDSPVPIQYLFQN